MYSVRLSVYMQTITCSRYAHTRRSYTKSLLFGSTFVNCCCRCCRWSWSVCLCVSLSKDYCDHCDQWIRDGFQSNRASSGDGTGEGPVRLVNGWLISCLTRLSLSLSLCETVLRDRVVTKFTSFQQFYLLLSSLFLLVVKSPVCLQISHLSRS